jgi:hypothetical protein
MNGRNPGRPKELPIPASLVSAACWTPSASVPLVVRYVLLLQQQPIVRFTLIIPGIHSVLSLFCCSGSDLENLDIECRPFVVFVQLDGIKRHGDLSFVLQPRPQGSSHALGASESEDSSSYKKPVRSKKVSQLRADSSPTHPITGSNAHHNAAAASSLYREPIDEIQAYNLGQSSELTSERPPMSSTSNFSPVSYHHLLQDNMSPRTPPPIASHRSGCKRRKGIPHRAPLEG